MKCLDKIKGPVCLPTSLRTVISSCVLSTLLCVFSPSALATFTVFNTEGAWQSTVGPTVLEDFESYTEGTQIPSLPALHLTFDELAGGGHPQAFAFGGIPNTTPYGSMHLGNFPNGVTNNINRWNDIVTRPSLGFSLFALGFWNGDGQADTLVAAAYGSQGQLLGSIGAFKGTFAGFLSDVPVAWVTFDGNTGDGFNHLDGLQVNATSIAEPNALLMMITGILAWTGVRRSYGRRERSAQSN